MVVSQSETNTYTLTAQECADLINSLLGAIPGAQIDAPASFSTVTRLTNGDVRFTVLVSGETTV